MADVTITKEAAVALLLRHETLVRVTALRDALSAIKKSGSATEAAERIHALIDETERKDESRA